MLHRIFIGASLGLFVIAACGVHVGPINLVAAGFACYVASALV